MKHFFMHAAELSLYASIVSMIIRLFDPTFSMPVFILILCLSTAFMDICPRSRWTRFIGIIIAAIPFLFIETVLDSMLILPPLIYTVITIILDRKISDYYSFRFFYVTASKIWLPVGIILLSLNWFDVNFSKAGSLGFGDPMGVFAWFVLFFAAGSVLLHQLRINTDYGRLEEAKETVVYSSGIVICLAVYIAMSYGFFMFLKYASKLLVRILEYLNILPALASALIKFDDYTENVQSERKFGEMTEEEVIERRVTILGPLYDEQMNEPVVHKFPWWAVILTVIITSAIFILLLRKKASYKPIPREDRMMTAPLNDLPKKGVFRRLDNRIAIRRIYRKFLLRSVYLGYSHKPYNTSRDVLLETSELTKEAAAAELRDLYLKARYNDPDTVTDEDVKRAGELLKHAFVENATV